MFGAPARAPSGCSKGCAAPAQRQLHAAACVGAVGASVSRHALLLTRSCPPACLPTGRLPTATLVLHLPSAYEGGQLVVSHAGRTKTFDYAADSAYALHFSAFYADCRHEVGGASLRQRRRALPPARCHAAAAQAGPAEAASRRVGHAEAWQQQAQDLVRCCGVHAHSELVLGQASACHPCRCGSSLPLLSR